MCDTQNHYPLQLLIRFGGEKIPSFVPNTPVFTLIIIIDYAL